jgi:DNA-binding response OmpR family regulator
MTSATSPPRVLLLVEDNPGDAQLVNEMLGEVERERYEVVHVPLMALALEALRSKDVDVVVLDLRLPDCEGIATVKAVRDIEREVPIVVLTGSDDEKLAMACIDAGAQDYLPKTEVRPQALRRAIGYAITRIRDAQVRRLEETLASYRTLSSSTQRTVVTASLAGTGAVALRNPEAFAAVVRSYYALIEPYMLREADRVVASQSAKELIVTALGDVNGGPRDLLDMHLAALDQALALHQGPHARSIVFESRLLALEMMGLLVDFYRVGHRRRITEGF